MEELLAGYGGRSVDDSVQQLIGTLPLRDIPRRGQKFFRLAVRVEDGADHHVEPHRFTRLGGREKPNEPAQATVASCLDGSSRGFAIRALPEINPGNANERFEVANLQHLHAACVHREQPSVKVEHLDAIGAAFDEACAEVAIDRTWLHRGKFKAEICRQKYEKETTFLRRSRSVTSAWILEEGRRNHFSASIY